MMRRKSSRLLLPLILLGILLATSCRESDTGERREAKGAQGLPGGELEDGEPDTGLLIMDSDASLDPRGAELFLVSVEFSLKKPVPLNARRKLIMKYVIDEAPYPGWALALHQTETSLRPELYWQDQTPNGGWWSFSQTTLEPDRRYVLSLAASPSFAALFLEDLSVSSAGAALENRYSGGDGNTEPKEDFSRVAFLGGYDVSSVGPIATQGKLQCLKESSPRSSFQAKVHSAAVVRLDRMPESRAKLKELIYGGPERLEANVSESAVALLLGSVKAHAEKAR